GGKAGGLNRLTIAGLACSISGVLDDRIGAIGDPSMAESDQMLGGHSRASLVVGAHDVAPLGRAGHEDGRHPTLEKGPWSSRAPGIGEKDDPGDTLLEKALEPRDLGRLLALGVAEHDAILSRGGGALDLLGHFGIERVGEISDDNAED